MKDIDAWKAELERERKEKDQYLRSGAQSPIPFMQRRKFPGLCYFPPVPGLAFELELNEHTDKSEFTVKDSKGNDRSFIRWGEFRFEVSGEKCTLQAYKSHAGEERLFIPFKDLTSGKETYGAGRYLETEHDYAGGKWKLDFNRAYNPYCAYSHNYACPLVPPENWLKVAIEAGEMDYTKP